MYGVQVEWKPTDLDEFLADRRPLVWCSLNMQAHSDAGFFYTHYTISRAFLWAVTHFKTWLLHFKTYYRPTQLPTNYPNDGLT